MCCALKPRGGEGISPGDRKGVGSFHLEESVEVKGLRNLEMKNFQTSGLPAQPPSQSSLVAHF